MIHCSLFFANILIKSKTFFICNQKRVFKSDNVLEFNIVLGALITIYIKIALLMNSNVLKMMRLKKRQV